MQVYRRGLSICTALYRNQGFQLLNTRWFFHRPALWSAHVNSYSCPNHTLSTSSRFIHSESYPPETSLLTSEWTPGHISRYITDVTEVTKDHLTPEIQLRLITRSCSLWAGRGEDCLVPDPFWAFYWPGGQALTRYILDHPEVVAGQKVLDVGSGCGASAIAARVSGASQVTANDICPVAAEAIKLNASLNNVTLDTDTKNLIGQACDQWDVIFLGDMFYDQEFTNMVTDWLEDLHARNKTILIGDPGRVYFENHPIRQRLKLLFSTDLFRQMREENNGITQGYVWAFT